MKVIGITGGVGSGKSTVLSLLLKLTHGIIIKADDVAADTILPDGEAYSEVVDILGGDVVMPDGHIDRKKMAAIIFSDRKLCEKVNAAIHPVTRNNIEKLIREADDKGYDYAFVEAALFIEAGYKDMCDELWYVCAPDEVRIDRLIKSRGYDRQKCLDIMANQLPDEQFRANCDYVIDNSGDAQAEDDAFLDGMLARQLKAIIN